MKKALLTVFITILVVFAAAVSAHAADFTIPHADTPPVIDGKDTSDDEWAEAHHVFLNYENGGWYGCVVGDEPKFGFVYDKENACKGYDVYFMYYNDPEEASDLNYEVKSGGIYIKIVAQDKTRGKALSDANGAYNATDVVQVVISPINSRSRPSNNASSYLYDFPFYTAMNQKNSDSCFYEHYQYKAGKSILGDSLGIKTQSTVTADGYFMEIQIPWKAINLGNRLPKHTPDSMMGLGVVIMDWVAVSPFYEVADFGSSSDDFLSALQNARKYNTVTFGEIENQTGTEVPKGDLSSLQESIATAEGLKESEYTSATWAAFSVALSDAKSVTENDSQETIDKVKNALDDAISALLKIDEASSYQILQSTIASVDNYSELDYSPDLWAEMQKALAEAKAITEKNSEEEIIAANEKLTSAIEKMINNGKSDTSALEKALFEAKAVKKTDLSEEDYASLQAAIAEAEKLTFEDSQEKIDQAVKTLNELTAKASSDSGNNKDKAETVEGSEISKAFFPWWGVLLIVVAVFAILIVVFIILKKKKTLREKIDGEEVSQPDDVINSTSEESISGDKESLSDNVDDVEK